jgi:exodeoxyribonuclease V alpha subunit
MLINFKGIGDVEVPEDYWNDIDLGYAMTVHKNQGSESNNVIFGLDFSSYALLTRELIYTGITRAKKKCILICQTGALRYATAQQAVSTKQTHLMDCLYEVAHPKLIF